MENTKIDELAKYTETSSSPIASPKNHQLWVNLSALGEGNVFSTVLSSLLKHYLIDGTDEMEDESFEIILPSDNGWQTKIYYKLVEKQRMIDSCSPDMIIEEEPKDIKLHEWNILPKTNTPACKPEPKVPQKQRKITNLAPITWTVSDLSKAGCLLTIPPLQVTFEDEQEMRRVYSLIYDVFRYKNVLTQALYDVAFYQVHPKLENTAHHIWLLFYDLYHRSFKKRETAVSNLASKLFDSVGLSYAENALWTQRVRLAAAVARLRIKHNALSLDELLPSHLKNEKVTEKAKHNPVTCWVNCLKVNDIKELIENIEKTFGLKMVSDLEKLDTQNFKWDRHCPQIMAFHSSLRGRLAKSQFVKSHMLVVQDKSFCRGAATFGKILIDLGLTGSVIQTHVNSPRTTAYLATLLTHNEKIKKLMAFSAGKRKPEYEHYFMELGVTNIRIFADRLIDSPPDATYMEEVVAVFATPPNSYSAVTDPIDLVCSRGGDLSMLEVLTESEETKEAKDRVISILEEQRKTLRFAMSRPQIQFVLYETHSELEAENEDMVCKTLKDINRLAKLQHAALLGKTLVSDLPMDDETQENNAENEKTHSLNETGEEIEIHTTNSEDSVSSKRMKDSKEKLLDFLQIPNTDIFITPELPNLCPNENSCINFRKEGCYLSLIQRKEIIRLDDKYMIQMAENRGLFGSTTTQNTTKSKSSKASRKKQEKSNRKPKSRKKLKESEINRIAAPTHTFLSHIKHDVQTREEVSQTSNESTDESVEEEDDNDQNNNHSLKTAFSASTSITSSVRQSLWSGRNILGRLTSAHIRQFVSPDFKEANFYNFYVPSLAFVSKTKIDTFQKLKQHTKRKIIENSKKIISGKSSNALTKPLNNNNMKKIKKQKDKMKKSVLERIRSPTLSFTLRTKKPENSTSEEKIKDLLGLFKVPPSPCERYRRNHLDK